MRSARLVKWGGEGERGGLEGDQVYGENAAVIEGLDDVVAGQQTQDFVVCQTLILVWLDSHHKILMRFQLINCAVFNILNKR